MDKRAAGSAGAGAALAAGLVVGVYMAADEKLPPAPLTPDEQKQVEKNKLSEIIEDHGNGVYTLHTSRMEGHDPGPSLAKWLELNPDKEIVVGLGPGHVHGGHSDHLAFIAKPKQPCSESGEP